MCAKTSILPYLLNRYETCKWLCASSMYDRSRLTTPSWRMFVTHCCVFVDARLKAKTFDANKLYCSEILSILLQVLCFTAFSSFCVYSFVCLFLQTEPSNQRRIGNLEGNRFFHAFFWIFKLCFCLTGPISAFAGIDGLDSLLQLVFQYRKTDPSSVDEQVRVWQPTSALCCSIAERLSTI